jgi:hypothetical protein
MRQALDEDIKTGTEASMEWYLEFQKRFCKPWKDIDDEDEVQEFKEGVKPEDIVSWSQDYIDDLMELIYQEVLEELSEDEKRRAGAVRKAMAKFRYGQEETLRDYWD